MPTAHVAPFQTQWHTTALLDRCSRSPARLPTCGCPPHGRSLLAPAPHALCGAQAYGCDASAAVQRAPRWHAAPRAARGVQRNPGVPRRRLATAAAEPGTASAGRHTRAGMWTCQLQVCAGTRLHADMGQQSAPGARAAPPEARLPPVGSLTRCLPLCHCAGHTAALPGGPSGGAPLRLGIQGGRRGVVGCRGNAPMLASKLLDPPWGGWSSARAGAQPTSSAACLSCGELGRRLTLGHARPAARSSLGTGGRHRG